MFIFLNMRFLDIKFKLKSVETVESLRQNELSSSQVIIADSLRASNETLVFCVRDVFILVLTILFKISFWIASDLKL